MNEEEVPFMRHSVHLERVRKAPEVLLRMRPPWGTPGAIGQQRLNTPCFVWSARRPCITPRHHEAGAPSPTIRADGSEVWFSWNPRRKSEALMIGLPVPQTRGTMFVPRDEARFFGLVEAVYPGDIGIGSLLRDTRLAMHGRVS